MPPRVCLGPLICGGTLTGVPLVSFGSHLECLSSFLLPSARRQQLSLRQEDQNQPQQRGRAERRQQRNEGMHTNMEIPRPPRAGGTARSSRDRHRHSSECSALYWHATIFSE
ncbi:uncharacterized protein [Eleutherodactylus coqui]|uniref:uncharacterized protein isoform X2 n=1 Tax=Eleutherodactylus coqui TaxID=57060 RepID=UPI003461922D